jgi:hypothetical protein
LRIAGTVDAEDALVMAEAIDAGAGAAAQVIENGAEAAVGGLDGESTPNEVNGRRLRGLFQHGWRTGWSGGRNRGRRLGKGCLRQSGWNDEQACYGNNGGQAAFCVHRGPLRIWLSACRTRPHLCTRLAVDRGW